MPDLVAPLASADTLTPTPSEPAGESPPPRRSPERGFALALGAAIALGVLVRVAHVLSADFPLNDGALFYLMVRELQQAHYHLPAFTSYNHAGIPFAYSPLGFYVAAFLADGMGMSLTSIFRFLPLAATALTVGAFALLARTMLAPLSSRAALIPATLAFGLVPRSYVWLLMGGGLTRSFGLLFAILTLHQVYLLFTRRSWRQVAPASLFSVLTVLSHLGTVPFVVFSSALFMLFHGRHRVAVFGSLVIGLATLILTAPWWGAILATHGIGPFIAAKATGGSVFTDHDTRNFVLLSVARFGLGTSEPLFPMIGALAVIGAIGAIASPRPGRLLLPIWWVAIVVLDARAGATYATLPLSMLAGIAVVEVIIPLLLGRPLAAGKDDLADERQRSVALPFSRDWRGDLPRPVVRRVALVLGFILVYSLVGSILTNRAAGSEGRWLVSLTPEERAAMRWADESTPATSQFLVISGPEWGGWWSDRWSEWFPVLANRVSVATVQGYEWLPNREFSRRWGAYDQAQHCANWLASCLDDWSRTTGTRFTYVFIPRSPSGPCCGVLTESLHEDPRYAVVHDSPGAIVFERLDSSAASAGRAGARAGRNGASSR